MFSVLGATEAEVGRLRAERGIYMVSDSRMNIAGLNAAAVPVLARAITDIVA
jgi:aromatic-amino-acid transaminase